MELRSQFGVFAAARILVIDDDEDNTTLLVRHLRRTGSEEVLVVSDPREALNAFQAFRPDAVLLDLRMRPLDGFDVLKLLQSATPPHVYLPVLMMTGGADEQTKERALQEGVADFVPKGLEPTELILRVRNVLRTRHLYQQVQQQNESLEMIVEQRTRELRAAQREVLERLALAAEFRDDATGSHTRRVGVLSGRIAECLEFPADFVEAIASAAQLHDLGKIGIPDQLLLKPGSLSEEEFDILRQHTVIGAQILSGCQEPVLAMAREIALTHHERWDGCGYPSRLAGEAIPITGRIVAVADSFDAMTSDRTYRAALPEDEALREIERHAGTQFDPTIANAFLGLMRDPMHCRQYHSIRAGA
jgi:putative two-component system response regulator